MLSVSASSSTLAALMASIDLNLSHKACRRLGANSLDMVQHRTQIAFAAQLAVIGYCKAMRFVADTLN